MSPSDGLSYSLKRLLSALADITHKINPVVAKSRGDFLLINNIRHRQDANSSSIILKNRNPIFRTIHHIVIVISVLFTGHHVQQRVHAPLAVGILSKGVSQTETTELLLQAAAGFLSTEHTLLIKGKFVPN